MQLLIPTRDRPLGQLQSHLAQVWSWARRSRWHQKSSSGKSPLQFGDLLRGTDSDRLRTTPHPQNPPSWQLQGHCDPWAPCTCREAEEQHICQQHKNTLAVRLGRSLDQPSAVQGLKGNLPSKAPAAPRNCVLEQMSVTGQPKGPLCMPCKHRAHLVLHGGWISQGTQGVKQHMEHLERLKVNPCAPQTPPVDLSRWTALPAWHTSTELPGTGNSHCSRDWKVLSFQGHSAQSCQEGDWTD